MTQMNRRSEIADHIDTLARKVIENETVKLGSDKKIEHELYLRKGVPVLEILKTVKENEIDLLSIGASGHNKLTRLFLGSTVAKIIRRSPCTIVVSPKND